MPFYRRRAAVPARRPYVRRAAPKRKYVPRVYKKKINTISGLGDYYSGGRALAPSSKPWYNQGGKYSRIAGGMLGGAMGSLAGPMYAGLGAKAGSMLGGAFHSITGLGDYRTMTRNTLIGMGSSPPRIKNSRTGNTIVRHREYLCDILSSTGFATNNTSSNGLTLNNASWVINPANSETFPWLSQIASNFQEYRMNGCVFEFKSTAGDAVSSTNNAMGTVIMSTQYNSNMLPFTTKQQMLEQEYSSDTKPCSDQLHPVECARRESPLSTLYVDSQGNSATDSQNLYNLGVFTIATQGMQLANVAIGELWVTYEIELLKPRLDTGADAAAEAILSGHLIMSGTGVASGALFGTTPVTQTVGSNIVMGALGTKFSIAAHQFQPNDKLFVIYACTSTAGAWAAPSISINNATVTNFWANDTVGVFNTASATGATQFSLFMLLNVTSTGQIDINLTAGTLPGSAPVADVYVTQSHSDLIS